MRDGLIPADVRSAAEAAFREHLAPLLRLAERPENVDATEIFIDGDEIRLSFGDRSRRYAFGDPDVAGLTPRDVRAAGAAAAVHAGLQFGARPPATAHFSVKIPPDLRVSYVAPPNGEVLHMALRFLRARTLTLDDYVARGTMTAGQRDAIRGWLHDPLHKKNVVVSGPTGSGKTTLLRAMIAEVTARERTLILEDTPELTVAGANVVHWHTSPGTDLAALLRQALRHTPDRIVVGEVRGPEALELVRAMNTGHDGTLCTLHSNGAEEVIARVHSLAAGAQPTLDVRYVRAALDAVVQITGKGAARRVTDVRLLDKTGLWGA